MRNMIGLICLTLAVMLVATTVRVDANPGFPVENEPVDIEKAARDQDGNVDHNETKKIPATTANNGQVSIRVRNATGEPVTDVHARAWIVDDGGRREPAKIKLIEVVGQHPFTETSPGPNDDPADSGSAKSPQGGGTLPDGDEVTVNLIIVGPQDEELGAGVKVEVEILWTRGALRDIYVAATSPTQVGDGDPRALMADISTQHQLGLVMGPAEVLAESQFGECNDLTIGECDGFRFQNGCLVLSPSNSTRFTGAESVIAYNIAGEVVSGTSRLSVSNLRVDVRGNFVVDIQRAQDDEEHIFLVIRGAQLTNIENHDVGQKVYAKVSGAAVAGYCMKNYFHLITVVP
jgi:hypothetical protein